MESILVKVFATALALSQVTSTPDAVKTEFDPDLDKAEVVRLLGAGCAHIRKEFDIDNIDLDDLIETVMMDKDAASNEVAVSGFKGIRFGDLHLAYRQICKQEQVETSIVDFGDVIRFYNAAVTDLPDHNRLKGLRLPGLSTVLDAKGAKFAELFEPDNRRHWVPLSEIPEHVQKAFIAAEDKRFFEHSGVDERSVLRAFMNMLADPKKRQGGSTISQQVAKNLLVGDDISYERKIREMIVAGRIEKALSKSDILEIYLNSIYLGRSTWGVELASRAYFGKRAQELTLTEGAFLAGLTKGPAYYNPDRYRSRARERLGYVLTRMREDNAISDAQMAAAEADRLDFVPHERVRRTTGFHFVDHVNREAKAMAGIDRLTATSYSIRSTIVPDLQRAAEAALQEGLARYEQNANRVDFEAAETNLAEAIGRLKNDPSADGGKPDWQRALEQVRMPLYDVHWAPAVVVEKRATSGFDSIRVGLLDGRILPLSTWGARTRSRIHLHDVVYVHVVEGDPKKKQGARVELRTRPKVQAASVVMENRTGRILAMVGSFSYPLSQLNRATQSRRQPGSSLKPLTYLAALSSGLQPNTLIQDSPITFPPIGGVNRYTRMQDWWSPRNYDGGFAGTMTLRRALEQSRNLPTARLLHGIGDSPRDSLASICQLAIEARLYPECEYYYPFILGAQPVRPVDMAAFYGAIANEGVLPTPHVIDSIEIDGRTVYRSKLPQRVLPSTDRASAFQMRTILQGVVERGTAASRRSLAPFIAGKTGTSDEWNDAWFVGFSNDVTIAVWVGYDNDRRRRTLGAGNAGSRVALPIFEQTMHAVWEKYAPRSRLAGPSPEAARQLIALPIDVRSGARVDAGRQAFMEYFKLDGTGRVAETQYQLVSRDTESFDSRHDYGDRGFGGLFAPPWYRRDTDRPGGAPFFRGPPTADSDQRYFREPSREQLERDPFYQERMERWRSRPRAAEPSANRRPPARRSGPDFSSAAARASEL
jgi:penicillin-binding protein 1A